MQEKLILIRKKNNISQKDFAKLIGISCNQYRQKENGKYQFNCDEMFTIADYLKLNVEDIFISQAHQNGINLKSKNQ